MKKINKSYYIVLFAVIFMTSFNRADSQEDPPPPSGTCCPTNSGAICIIGTFSKDGYYYLSSGDCPDREIQ